MDLVSIDHYHEAELALKLGYSLFCRVEGIPADLVVRDVRLVGEANLNPLDEVFIPAAVTDLERHLEAHGFAVQGDNLEVLTLEGWRKPSRCWAVGDGSLKLEPPATALAEQKGLF